MRARHRVHIFALFIGLLLVFVEQTAAYSLMNIRIRDFEIHWKDKDRPIDDSVPLTMITCAGVIFHQNSKSPDCEYINSQTLFNITSIPKIIQIPISSRSVWPTKDWRLAVIISDVNSDTKFEVTTDFYNVTSHSEEQFVNQKGLSFYFTLVCAEHQYGPSCRTTCNEAEKNPKGGNVHCDKMTGEKICSKGWKGVLCDIPVCEKKCIYGTCIGPNVCNCSAGWRGSSCDECLPLQGCQHGYCQKAHQCICERQWGGQHCDIDLDHCSHHPGLCQHGGSCTSNGKANYYYCNCTKEYEGRNCEIPKSVTCKSLNCGPKGVCDDSQPYAKCQCAPFSYGDRCQYQFNKTEETENLGSSTVVPIVLILILIAVALLGYRCRKEYRKRNKKNRQLSPPMYSTQWLQTDNQQRLKSVTYIAGVRSISPPPSYESQNQSNQMLDASMKIELQEFSELPPTISEDCDAISDSDQSSSSSNKSISISIAEDAV